MSSIEGQETGLEIDNVLGLLALRSGAIDGLTLQALAEESGGGEKLLSAPEKTKDFSAFHHLIRQSSAVDSARNDLKQWSKKGIGAICITGSRYPPLLKTVYEPPAILFYRGPLNPGLSERPAIAIVGSRRADLQGCRTASSMALEISSAGSCIVSGLAYGVDAAAHEGALQADSKFPTVAVLGNGLASVYPAKHEGLAKRILDEGGMIISQFEPDEKPYPSNFLNRNRIIAGMSAGTLVIQATAKSGSLVTARYALDEGREVMAVPGSIDEPRYEGSNNLLKQGAHLVTAVEDVFEILPNLRRRAPAPAKEISAFDAQLSEQSRKIVSYLRSHGQVHYDRLQSEAGVSGNGLHSELLSLELAGVIARYPGNQVALVR